MTYNESKDGIAGVASEAAWHIRESLDEILGVVDGLLTDGLRSSHYQSTLSHAYDHIHFAWNTVFAGDIPSLGKEDFSTADWHRATRRPPVSQLLLAPEETLEKVWRELLKLAAGNRLEATDSAFKGTKRSRLTLMLVRAAKQGIWAMELAPQAEQAATGALSAFKSAIVRYYRALNLALNPDNRRIAFVEPSMQVFEAMIQWPSFLTSD